MSRGGYRAGAGRPKKGDKSAINEAIDSTSGENSEMTPVEYMLSVMRDPDQASDRRDRMAIAAAPYVHVRPSVEEGGKKEKQKKDADKIANGESKYQTPDGPKLVISN